MWRMPPAGGGVAARCPFIEISLLGFASVLQIFWGPLSEHRFGPISAIIFLMAGLVTLLSLTIAVWPRKPEQSSLLSVAVPLLFAAVAAVQLATSFGFELGSEPVDDIIDLLPSLAAAVGLLMVFRIYGNSVSVWIVAVALVIQVTAALDDIADDWLVSTMTIETTLSDWVSMIASGLALAGYACALLIELSRLFPPKSATTDGSISMVRLLNAVEHTKLGTQLSAGFNDVEYLIWRFTGGGPYSDFYAAQVARKLARGKSHKTLGNKQYGSGSTASTDVSHDEDSFASQGAELFDLCKRLGLSEQDVVVDYGCGSLRIGQHFIKFLKPGGYWGLDVTGNFYRIGLTLLPKTVLKRKRPQCHVINEQSLAAARRARPSFIFICNAVLKHVPQNELGLFMDRMLGLAQPGTRVILSFHRAPALARIRGKSWAYPAEAIRAAIRLRFPGAQIENLSPSPESSRDTVPMRREKWLIKA